MRTVALTDPVDLKSLTSKPGIYVARADTPAYGDLMGFVVAGEVAELGQAMSPDGVHMLAVQVGPKANPAITIGAEFFAGAKADYSYWQEKWWREAIQNAVDAGSTSVQCVIETINDRVRVTCSDNGSGMDEETLLNKFLVLGRSGKGGEPGSVGGFGKAKELLLLPWISWAVQTKKDGHPGVVVEGHGIQYDVKPIDDTRGTTITVEMAPDDCTTQAAAINFIKKCYLPHVKFTVNGESVKANLKVGELVRTIENDANIYYDPKVKNTASMMLVRVNGMYMHERYISSDIKGIVIVELLGPSTLLLTSNRDGIGKREVRWTLDEFQNELAANTKTALRKKKNVVRERFHGEGKFSIKPELVQRDILVAVGDLTPAGAKGTLSADQQADVQRVVEAVGAVANEVEGAQIDLRVPKDAIKAMMEISFLGPLHVKTLARQASWQPDFFIYNEVEDFKVPSRFRPDKMPPTLRKLARFWAELCRFVLIQLNYEGDYGVGWIFELNTGAAHLHLENEDWLLLNPFVDGNIGGSLWTLSSKSHLDWLYAAAVHEATHLVDGIKMHDESFAAAFTNNVAKTANRGRLIERIRKAVVARGALPGAGIERMSNPCGCKHNPCVHNPAPVGTRYRPAVAVDEDDLADMTFLNALRTVFEFMVSSPGFQGGDIEHVAANGDVIRVATLRPHRNWESRWVLDVVTEDMLPDGLDVWQLPRASLAPWAYGLVAVVPALVPAPGELDPEETNRRLARRAREVYGGPTLGRCWDVFHTNRGFELQIDDECFSGVRDTERVADSDLARLPEAQDALRSARLSAGEDMADDIDQQIELGRQARAAVATALNIPLDSNSLGFVDQIVQHLNFTVEFRRPHEGEFAWEVEEAGYPEDARDEIWRESEDFGWRAQHDVGHATQGMKYAVITPAADEEPEAVMNDRGNLQYVVNKWLTQPERFTTFAERAATRVADSASIMGDGRAIYRWGEHRIESRGRTAAEDVRDEGLARIHIHNAMHMRGSALMTAEQQRDANAMITRVATRMFASEPNQPNWAAIEADFERADTHQFERYVLECANDVGLVALDAQGQPYSLQRPPTFWTYRNSPWTITVPIDYERPDTWNEIEIAVGNALELNQNIPEARDFVAAVWEEILRRRNTGQIHSLPSRVDEAAAFGAHIREAARAIAREEERGFDFGNERVVNRWWIWNNHQLPMHGATPTPVPPERRIISGSQIVPGMRGTRTGGAVLSQTNGGRGEYPSELNRIVSGLRDTSYGNDVYDSVEFSVGQNVYRLWVAPFVRNDREEGEDPRYQVQRVEPPYVGASLTTIFEDGQPTGDVIFETEEPAELIEWARTFTSTAAQTRTRDARNTTGMAMPYVEDYLRVLDAMDDLDNIGAPGDADYIRIMNGTAALATERMRRPRFTPRIDALLLTDPQFEEIRVAINRLWDTALGRDEEDSEDFHMPMQRIADEATRRARVVSGERVPPSRAKQEDMSDVRGQPEAVEAAEKAVSWRQNLLLIHQGAAIGATTIAKRIPTLFPAGAAPFQAPHSSIKAADVTSVVEQARGGVLYLDEYDDFQPDALRAFAVALRKVPAAERPLVVASIGSTFMPMRRAITDIIDFPLRGTVVQIPAGTKGAQAPSSEVIRARIAAAAKAEPEDPTAARFGQLELGRGRDPGSPVARSKRLQVNIPVGTRVHVISSIIRPPEQYIPRGNAGEVTENDDNLGGRVEVTFDDGTKVVWTGSNFEQLAAEIEAEPESAQRYRMIEMNPKRRMKHNPPWVTKLLTKHFEFMEDKVPAKWLPRLGEVHSSHGLLAGDFKEYGCGKYGCVYPTLDKNVVLKVTTDDTEAEFAEQLANFLPEQVTVKYHLVARLPERHNKRDVWLLWRDAADHVGGIFQLAEKEGRDVDVIEEAIAEQHKAAQKAFVAVVKVVDPAGAKDMAKRMGKSKSFTPKEMVAVIKGQPEKYLEDWRKATLAMGQKVPELADLANGMVENNIAEGVMFGDVHDGNLGRVNGRWLIVDPGHVSVYASK